MTMETRYERVSAWDFLCPDGAVRYYEGDDPDGFAAEMLERYGFDVRQPYEDKRMRTNWEEYRSFLFLRAS
jgi:hypothetical protein